MKQVRVALLALTAVSVTALSAELRQELQQQEPSLFTNGVEIVTLVNDHTKLPSTCQFKGRVSANRTASDRAPVDPVTRMVWYIETSQQHRANYLLGNAKYESLWAYRCSPRVQQTATGNSQ